MDNQWLGQDSRVETEVKAMVRTIEAGVLDLPPLSGHWVEMSGENDDEVVDLGFSVGYPAWDEAKFAVSDVVSNFTDDKLGTYIGTQILWPISVWLWDVGDCHLFITDCERLVLPCNWNSRDSMLEDPPKMFNINSIPKPLLWDSCGDKSFSLKPPGAVSDNGDGLLLRSAMVSPLLQLTGIMIGCSPHSVCEPWQKHVRFRTVPEKASMMPWRHDGVTLSHPAVQRNICFRWFWMLRRCTADPQLDSEVVHGTFSDRTKGYTGLVSPIVPDASQRGSRTVPQSTTWF